MASKVCALCGGGYRDWATHMSSARHQRAMHPAGSRKGTKANARRARAAAARRNYGTSSRGYARRETEHYDSELSYQRQEQKRTGRHFYGRWTPFGVSAFMGGHPARAMEHVKRAHRHVRRVLRSQPRAGDDA